MDGYLPANKVYKPNEAIIAIAVESYNMAKNGTHDNDSFIINRLRCLVEASKKAYYNIDQAIWSAENQLAQVTGDAARMVCMDLLNTLRSRKS